MRKERSKGEGTRVYRETKTTYVGYRDASHLKLSFSQLNKWEKESLRVLSSQPAFTE